MTVSHIRLAVITALAASLGCTIDKGGVAGVLVVAAVDVTPGIGSVVVNGTTPLTASPKTLSGIPVPGRTVVWSSLDPGIATVSSAGVVTGVSAGGPVTIRATVDGITGDALITVHAVAINSVTVSPPANPLVAGQSVQLTATARDAGGAILTGRSFLWETSDLNIASVTTNGMVQAVSAGGPVTISATSEGKIGTATVTVTPRPADRLGFAQQPTTTPAGAPFTPPVKVAIQDAVLGTVVAATNPVTIALAANAAGATLSGTTTVAATNGVATFGNLTLDRVGTGYTFLVTSPNLTSSISAPFSIIAGAAGRLALTTSPPATAQSGVALNPQPVVQLVDGSGNNVPQVGIVVTATLTSGTGTLGGTVTVPTNASGAATFTSLTVSGLAGPYVLGFSSPGVTSVNSGTITLRAGPAAALTIARQPSASAQTGVPLAQQPTVQITDPAGNPVAQGGVVVTASLASGVGTLGGFTTAATNAAGLATFTSLAINGVVGLYTLQFAAPGFTPTVSGSIALAAGNATAMAPNSAVSQIASAGSAVTAPPSVRVTDANSNPVLGIPVVFTVLSGSGSTLPASPATVTTDAVGVATLTRWTLGTVVGTNNNTVRASLGALTPVVFTASATAAAANRIAANSPTTQSAQVGTAVAAPPSVLVTDQFGNPVGGFAVSFAVTGGGGTVMPAAPATVTTNALGVATVTSWTLGASAGANTVNASAVIPVGSPVTFTATGTSAAATNILANSVTTQSAVAGTAVAIPPSVKVTDGVNPVQGVVVTFAITSGGGSISGPASVATDAAGIATVGGWTLGPTPGTSNTLHATSGTLTGSPVIFTASATVGPAAKLVITLQPVGGASGALLATQPVIAIQDAQGHTVTTDNTTQVSVAISSGAGGTLGGTTTVTAASGIATFTNLTLAGTTGVPYVLQFTSNPTLTPASSGNVTVTTPTQLTYDTQPSSAAQSGVAFAQPPVLLVQDAGNNPVPDVLVTATITGSPAGVSFLGTTTATSNGSGLATFTGLGLSGTVGNYTLTFTAGALNSGASNTIALSAGPAARLTITTQPSASADNDVAFAQQPAIQLEDASGNLVSQSGTTVTAAIASGGGTLGGTPTATTDINGLATFTDLKITGTVGARTLTFSSGSLTAVGSNAIDIGTGVPTQLTYVTQPPANAADGAAFTTQPMLQLGDVSNNPVASTTVTASTITPAGASFVGLTTSTTNSAGRTAFSNLGLTGTSGNYTIAFTAGAVTSPASNTIALTAAPHHLSITTQPPASVASNTQFPPSEQPVIQVRDAANNPVGTVIQITAALVSSVGCTGNLAGSKTVSTDSFGVAAFATLKIVGPGTCQLRFTASGLIEIDSNLIIVTP